MFRTISTTCHKAGRLLSGGDFRRKRLMRRVVRDDVFVRYLGRHGSRHLVELRHRGKPALRYLSLAEFETQRYNGSEGTVSSTELQEQRQKVQG